VAVPWPTLVVLASPPSPAAEVVVAAEPSLDAERLADALRVYLAGFGIRVAPRADLAAADLRKRLDDAHRLGEAVRAVAVVRIGPSDAGAIEIELVDLATDKTLLVAVPRPPRDEDLYRALALKIQAVLRATLSEARATLDPQSSLGLLVAEKSDGAREARLALDVGLGWVAFPWDGPSFLGLGAQASWRPKPRLVLSLATAALASEEATTGAVSATATLIPVRLGVKRAVAFAGERGELAFGPCVELAYLRVATDSTTTLVRSTRALMASVGVEVEGHFALLAGAWLFARAAALGVLNGARYGAAGTTLFDTAYLETSAVVGVGVGLP